jgi:hypothetical protein
VAVALLASTAGFAFGHAGGGSERVPSSTASRIRAAPQQQPAYAHAVGDALGTLKARRAAERARLRSAHRAARQAVQAAALASAYRDARLALAQHATAKTAGLTTSLAQAEAAYRKLVAAARKHDARAFRAAGAEVVRRESEVDQAIAALNALQPA